MRMSAWSHVKPLTPSFEGVESPISSSSDELTRRDVIASAIRKIAALRRMSMSPPAPAAAYGSSTDASGRNSSTGGARMIGDGPCAAAAAV